MNHTLPVEDRGTAQNKVYNLLKEHILSGQIEPGGRIHQEMCADFLHVSRTPVREALQMLAQEGLVERIEDRGFRVIQLSMGELEELFDMRAALEAFAMRIVCQRITPEIIETLSKWIDESEAALQRQDVEGVFQSNTSFHNTLYAIIHDKKRFRAFLDNMKDHILRYRKQTLTHMDRAEKSINAHKKILFALKTKDPNLTEYLMRIHIQESKEDALQINFGIANAQDAPEAKRLMCMAVE